jgi:hypothetical protein
VFSYLNLKDRTLKLTCPYDPVKNHTKHKDSTCPNDPVKNHTKHKDSTCPSDPHPPFTQTASKILPTVKNMNLVSQLKIILSTKIAHALLILIPHPPKMLPKYYQRFKI